jgi:ELWxxDGT repeat protein
MKKILLRLASGALLPWQILLPVLLIFNPLSAQIALVKDIDMYGDPANYQVRSLIDVDGTLYFNYDDKFLGKTDGTPAGTINIKSFISIRMVSKLNGQLIFAADDGVSGGELWKSDGTAEGTVKIKDIRPGATGSDIANLFALNNAVYFLANDGVSGPELWRTDGTETGTTKVKDIRPGVAGSGISNCITVNGVAYFLANDGVTGAELWRSDGTATGTFRVKDVLTGKNGAQINNLISFNNKIFFVANNNLNGFEVWVSDGTEAGTGILKDIMPGKSGSAPNYLTVSGNALYFMARDPAFGQEVWKTDGTPAGTVLLKDIFAGATSSFPKGFIDVDGTLFFEANDGIHGFEFWKSDGTSAGTVLATDINKGKSGSLDWLHDTGSANGILYFQIGRYVYMSDGTLEGTHEILNAEYFYSGGQFSKVDNTMYFIDLYGRLWKLAGDVVQEVKDMDGDQEIDYNGNPCGMTKSGGLFYFLAADENGHSSLWRSDGTTDGTFIIKQSQATYGSNPTGFADVNGTLFFSASGGRVNSEYFPGLWKSDGTEEGTVKILDNIYLSNITNVNGTAYFATYAHLWKSDGTPEGTKTVLNQASFPYYLTDVKGTLYFSAQIGDTSRELWKTNGTEAGTILVENIGEGISNRSPENLVTVDSVLYFTAYNGSGQELWRTKDNGAIMLRDIYPGVISSYPHELVAHKNLLFFVASNGTNGFELWRSNGTKPGTVMVTDINSGDAAVRDIKNLKSAGGKLYFAAQDASGWALWRSNSTAVGTVKVKDFYPGNENIVIVGGMNNDAYILVSAEDFSHHELWKTNGTEAGTVKLKTLGDFGSPSAAYSLTKNGVLYLNIPNHNGNTFYGSEYQLWRTDGTECGTFRIDNGASYPFNMTQSGSNIFFAAEYPNGLGRELYKLNEGAITAPPCIPTASARLEEVGIKAQGDETITDDDQIISTYPNPYNREFVLHVKGESDDTYQVSVINMKGENIHSLQDLKCNVDYNVGASWTNGVYLLRVNTSRSKSFTKKIMKAD